MEKTHNDDNNDKTLCTVLRLIQAVFLRFQTSSHSPSLSKQLFTISPTPHVFCSFVIYVIKKQIF